MRWWSLPVVLALLGGCGDAPGYREICNQACMCAEPGCRIFQRVGSSTLTVTEAESPAECETHLDALYALSGEGDADADCLGALGDAMCIEVSSTEVRGLALPPSCL